MDNFEAYLYEQIERYAVMYMEAREHDELETLLSSKVSLDVYIAVLQRYKEFK